MLRQLGAAALIALAVFAMSSSSSSIDLGPGRSIGSFKYGRIKAGDLKLITDGADDRLYRTPTEKSLGGSFDYPIAPHFHIGVAADLNYCYDRLAELSLNLKGLIADPQGRFALRPGIGVGGAASRLASFLTVRASSELQVSVSEKFGLGIEAGVWYTPSGGDETYSVRIGPLTYIRGAVIFASGEKKRVRNHRARHDPLPYQGAIKIGMITVSRFQLETAERLKFTDRSISVGASADFRTPLLAFIGAALDYHKLGRSESLLVWGLRGSPIAGMALGEIRVRPVGLIGMGIVDQTIASEYSTDHMVYGGMLEVFWKPGARPGWLFELQYLKVDKNKAPANFYADLESLWIIRFGMTF